MLELRGGVAFRVDVRDLLELQRALHGNGVQRSPAQKQRVVFVREDLGKRLDGRVQFQGLLDQTGQLQQLRDQVALPRRAGAVLGQRDGQHRERSQLRGERLGGRDSDL